MSPTAEQVPEAATYPVPSRLLDPKQCPTPHVSSMEQYRAMWKESVEQPDKFFGNVSDFNPIYHGSFI